MAYEEQLKILQQGVEAWNEWKTENPDERIDLFRTYLRGADLSSANLHNANLNMANLIEADLREANLSGANLSSANLHMANLIETNLRRADLSLTNLSKANLSGADLSKAALMEAYLVEANLSEADLSSADLRNADLSAADLRNADLSGADLRGARLNEIILIEAKLRGADLRGANLHMANLSGANLSGTVLVETNLEGAILAGCNVYGVSAWGLKLKGAIQKDLVITPLDQPEITVDNLEVAQFIYLLIHNEKIRNVIDTITSKVVLILGRFTPGRKVVLNAIREELRERGYLPVLFDFEKPTGRDLTETISTLAHMARFVIADITDAMAVPIELKHIVPMLPSVPVQPLILDSQYEYTLFDHIRGFCSVLEPYRYENQSQLLATIEEKVIAPAEEKVREIRNQGCSR